MGNIISQMFPPKPQFTEANLPDLEGRVYIITGSSAGIGKELARMLYSKNARVYLANRDAAKTAAAAADIRAAVGKKSAGSLETLTLDLGDLTTIRPAADAFLARESRLDVLFNNAAVMAVKDEGGPARTTRQGHEIHLGTNNLGTFLLTHHLRPVLAATAAAESAAPRCRRGGVRVVWVSSTVDMVPSGPRGFPVADLGDPDKLAREHPAMVRYGLSKVGNYLHAVEWARRYSAGDGVVSVALNPGNLRTELYREHGKLAHWVLGNLILYPQVNGACTELYAGLSEDVGMGESGRFVMPFGRLFEPKDAVVKAGKPVSEGGTGDAEKFWEWTEEQLRAYL